MSGRSLAAITLVGCGNIGFRHLQALCGITVPSRVTVVEPNTDAHPRILEQVASAASSPHEFVLRESLPDDAAEIDLLVVTTTADVRRSVVESILDRASVRTAILEKVLFQTRRDLDDVAELLDQSGTAAFVNCARRAFAGYERLRDRWAGTSPVRLEVRGNRFGLASNALHFLDLAEHLSASQLTSIDVADLEPGSVPGRRPGTIEVFGTLRAELADGSTLTVDCFDEEPVRIVLTARSGDDQVEIDELARTISEGDRVEAFASQNVSETIGPYEHLLSTGTCELTPYADSHRQHRLYLDAVRAHLGLSVPDDEPCPIT